MSPGEGQAIRERTYSMILCLAIEYLLTLLKVDIESEYGIRFFVIVLVPDAVRLVITVLVAGSVPVWRMREPRESTFSDTDSAFQWKQLILSYIALCIGIFLSTWHAVFLSSPNWGQSSDAMLFSVALLSMNISLVVVHMAVIGCSSYTHRRPPLGHVAKPALQLAAVLLVDTSHDSPCAICLCDLEIGECVTQLRCKHLFHTQCIVPWVAKSNRCPLRCTDTIEVALCNALVVKDAELQKLTGSNPNTQQPWSSRPVSPTAPSNQANPVSDSSVEDVVMVF